MKVWISNLLLKVSKTFEYFLLLNYDEPLMRISFRFKNQKIISYGGTGLVGIRSYNLYT